MKKTVSVNIAGSLFNIDDDAYLLVEQYIKGKEHDFNYVPQWKEMLKDLEFKLAEILKSRIQNNFQSVTIDDVNHAISLLGKPKCDGQTTYNQESNFENSQMYNKPVHKLYRNPQNKVLGGVCGGIGAYFDIDPVIIRIILVILAIGGFVPFAFFFHHFLPGPILIYIIMWIVIPNAITINQKLEMYGWSPTPENVRRCSY